MSNFSPKDTDAKPVRRRVIQVSDSDSEECDEIIHTIGNGNSRVKSPIVMERERKVQYLMSHFPTVELIEIYELITNVQFNVDVAINRLKGKYGSPTNIVEYDRWKLQLKLKQLQGVKKRVQPEQTKKVKRRRVDNPDDSDATNEYDVNRVFNSDEDSEVEVTNERSGMKGGVLEFLQTAPPNELLLMHGTSKKKIDAILAARPFNNWVDLVEKLKSHKNLNTDLLNYAQQVLVTRENIKKLMNKCTNIASKLEIAIKAERAIKMQPKLISPSLKLTDYQLVGLNWLTILHAQGLNGILADEMGLGKTVQVIAFLSHLKEMQIGGTHLVVVPASTLDNWSNEFARWSPSLRILLYYGTIDERRDYRMMFARGEHKEYDVVLTTYNLVAASPEERKMFRVTSLHYVIFDEAHMLKNMNTQRYEHLMRIRASSRILITGTPLQNNLLELMSLLIFVMPEMFAQKIDDLKSLFKKKSTEDEAIPNFEREQIEQAKRIMRPFVLRRLKIDVLQHLPKKTDTKMMVPMLKDQEVKYKKLIADFQAAANSGERGYNGMSMMTDLRKMANHPLLLRYYYKENDLQKMAAALAKDPDHKDTVEQYIFDDLRCMSDFDISEMTNEYLSIKKFVLPKSLIPLSGKFMFFDKQLPELKRAGHRVLIFSQYVLILNIMEVYMKMRKHSFLRLDGQTPVITRQQLIDEFNNDESIFVFLLSTRAGGLGINLTSADTVIIHDIDFNPYNDKQAEDRCHRMGQKKPVQVFRLISEGTIEEGMWRLTQDKLELEREITSDDYENMEAKSVVSLLSATLRMDEDRVTNLVSPTKSNGTKL